jgi:hypothetical protein
LSELATSFDFAHFSTLQLRLKNINVATVCVSENDEGITSLKDTMLEFCKLQRELDQFAEAAKFVVNEVVYYNSHLVYSV